MNGEIIKVRLQDMADALIEKGYLRPEAELQIISGGDFHVWIRTATDGDIPGKHEWVESAVLADVLSDADALIDSFEAVEVYKKKAAVKQFGRAVDGLRNAGFEAEFCDPLSEQLQAMSENLLAAE